MTQEEKDLLLKDLSARLPYGVKVRYSSYEKFITCTLQALKPVYNIVDLWSKEACFNSVHINKIKPYLFPLSNMSEEQKKYVTDRWGINENFNFEIDPNWGEYFVELGDVLGFINWCYENHFDINRLIPKGLAIDATNKNIY